MTDRPTTDLVERLQAAATAAITDVGPTLTHEPGRLERVMVELRLANGGRIIDVLVTSQRRATVGAGV